jgi:hypothetical protein
LPVYFLDGLRRFVGVGFLFRQVGDHDVGPFPREENGDAAADSGIAARD